MALCVLDVVPEPVSQQESDFIDLFLNDTNHPQEHPTLNQNEILMRVAQRRATDMVVRNYFDHVDPDGFGANHHCREAGFDLHDSYGAEDDDNNVESIGNGTNSASTMWSTFMNSPGHKAHLLGELIQPGDNTFWRDQTEYGVGFATNGISNHKWAVIIARPN